MKKNRLLGFFSNTDKFYLKIFLFYLVSFFLFRLIFLFYFRNEYQGIDLSQIIKSFFIGMRTDITIIGYIIAPFFLIGHIPVIGIEFNKIHFKIQNVLLFIAFSLMFFLHLINLNFFHEYNSHLNVTLFAYLDTPKIIISMLWQEFPIIKYLLFFVVILLIFFFLYKKIAKIEYRKVNLYIRIFIFIFSGGLLFLGIRGGVNESTINWGSVYFSKHAIVNQTALNPVFHLYKSVYYTNKAKKKNIASKIKYFDSDSLAYNSYKKNIKNNKDNYLNIKYPFYKETNNLGEEKKYNVVLVLMESFSAELCSTLGGKYNLTPKFDELSKGGILFENFFSNGQRTNRGISATFTSFPALNTKSILKQVEGQQNIPSIGSILKEKGYSTFFIYGGDLEFDNMKGFLLSKGVDNFIGEKDFDKKTFLNKWGAPDEYIFEKVESVLDNNIDNPVFIMMLSLTNHPPYVSPPGDYERVNTESKFNANYNTTKYADYAIGKFMDKMKDKPYYDNTLFIFLGDHSKSYHHDLEFDYRASHVPCLLYSSSLADSLKGKRIETITAQIDLAPTIFSFLNMKTKNSFMGRDVLSVTDRGFALIANNKRIGFLQDDFYLMGKLGESFKLLRYKDYSGEDISEQHLEKKQQMYMNMMSLTQSAYSVFKKRIIAPN